MSTIASNNISNVPSSPTALTVGTVTPHAVNLATNGVNYLTISATGQVLVNGMALGNSAGNQPTNSVFGSSSGITNTTGSGNTFVGYQTGKANTSGSSNTFLGTNAGANNTDSQNNTCIGTNTGAIISTGASNNTFLGAQAGASTTTGNNQVIIGYAAAASVPSALNEVTLGNGSVAVLRCQATGITSLSDSRDKTEIADLSVGLSFVNTLRPVSFKWNTRDGAKVGIADSGFLAQELQAAETSFAVSDVLGLVSSSNPEKLEANYSKLLPVMVKAIQELSAQVTELKEKLGAKGCLNKPV